MAAILIAVRHQSRFAGAVFADNAVDDAALNDKIDVVVGVNGAEALVDADEFDGGRRFVARGRHAILLDGDRPRGSPSPRLGGERVGVRG